MDALPGEYPLSNYQNSGSRPQGDVTDTDEQSVSGRVQPGLLYSRVVSPRIPSPVPTGEAAVSYGPYRSLSPLSSLTAPEPSVEDSQSQAEAHSPVIKVEEDDSGEWILSHRGRHGRTASQSPTRVPRTAGGRAEPLTTDQRAVVRMAEDSLSPAERERLEERFRLVREARAVEQPASSRGEGPSSGKGKTVDAREWGAVGIPLEELDPETQLREYERLKGAVSIANTSATGSQAEWPPSIFAPQPRRASPAARSMNDPSQRLDAIERQLAELVAALSSAAAAAPGRVLQPTTSDGLDSRGAAAGTPRRVSSQPEQAVRRTTARTPSPSRSKVVEGRADSLVKPVYQLEPGSYLGRALHGLEYSDSDGSDDPDSSSSESEGSSPRRSCAKRGKKSRKSRIPVLKPRDPDVYDGAMDMQVRDDGESLRSRTSWVEGHMNFM